jgi:FixJ family two-component response regulator
VSDLFPPVVCVVDDDTSVGRSLVRLLESDGFKAESFSEPESFLAYLTKHSVRLAILDIWMDKMTGMELLAHLCARSPSTRVIFVTAHEDHGAETTVMQAGAFAFFIKPLDNTRFLEAVHRALDQTSAVKNSVP